MSYYPKHTENSLQIELFLKEHTLSKKLILLLHVLLYETNDR